MRRKRQAKRGAKGLILVLALMVWAAILTGCSGSNDDSDSAAMADKSAPMEGAMPSSAPVAEAQTNVVFGEEKGSASSSVEDRGEAAAPAQTTTTSTASQGSAISASSIGVIADANAGFNRKMIYTASVVLKAKSFRTAEEAVSNAIFQSGGFIVQFADTKSEREIGSTYVIKVPSSGLSNFISLLEEIPNEDFDRKMQGSDVTEEYVDLESRLAAKQAVEARLLAFMEKATKADDLVRFSSELGGVQEEIEQIKGRMRYLDQNVAYSTVNLRLYETIEEKAVAQEEKKEKSLGAKLSDTMRSSTDVLGNIGEGILTFLAAVLPILLVLIVIGGPVYWAVMRTRSGRKERAELRRKLLNADLAAARTVAEEPEPASRKDSPAPKEE
ncbi:DUF4349 domain-containing protein [Cohnella thailandensis]|uniref:DUF4349 domain-containing protein n=1 Tax=Cohnella thailandensis TaxID=557557 RepID=A0A841T342_9BACL|nr:DUF4349 domain-containing protein [Cohnella thailandensis]MBB6636297.1 DUF4349 domain-containing protein [Cohnella thailandensis]MBP1973734.1 hypothetical protein [Cohnella thailandensis]